MLWATFMRVDVVPQVSRPRPHQEQQQQPTRWQDEENALRPEDRRIVEKMNQIIFPSVAFQNITVEEALEFLRVKSRDLDTTTEDRSARGVSIVLRQGDAAANEARITLDLKDVSMAEALRYVTELGQMTYVVESAVVVVRPHYQVADHLYTHSFHVPPDFMMLGEMEQGATADPFATTPVDPFAFDPKPSTLLFRKRKTAKQILEAQGIPFPEGASARFIAATRTLEVRNTQPNMDLAEALLGSMCICEYPGGRPTIAITAQVLQGPGPLLRRMAAQAAPLNDHRAQIDELLAAVKAGTAQLQETARIETKSGTRATAEQGRDFRLLTGITLAGDEAGGPALQYEPRLIGFSLAAEPLIGADNILIELGVTSDYHTAPPLPQPEHLIDARGRRLDFQLADTHLSRLETELTLTSGTTRLLHLWKPTGHAELEKQDVLQVMFITCDILRGPVK